MIAGWTGDEPRVCEPHSNPGSPEGLHLRPLTSLELSETTHRVLGMCTISRLINSLLHYRYWFVIILLLYRLKLYLHVAYEKKQHLVVTVASKVYLHICYVTPFIRVKCRCNNQACFLLEVHDVVTLNIVLDKSSLLFSELSCFEG